MSKDPAPAPSGLGLVVVVVTFVGTAATLILADIRGRDHCEVTEPELV